jgi:hypothetical protein
VKGTKKLLQYKEDAGRRTIGITVGRKPVEGNKLEGGKRLKMRNKRHDFPRHSCEVVQEFL